MMAVLFFLIKAYVVVLIASGVFSGVAVIIQGVQKLLGLNPYGVWANLAVAWTIMGGFFYLVGHLIVGFLTPVN